MFETFTPDAKRAIVNAQGLAREARSSHIEVDDIVSGVLQMPGCMGSALLAQLEVDIDALRTSLLRERPHEAAMVEGELPFTADSRELIEQLRSASTSLHDEHIGTEHLLLVALVIGRSRSARLINANGVDAARYRAAVAALPGRTIDGTYAGMARVRQAVEHLKAGDGPPALHEAEQALEEASDAGAALAVTLAQNLMAWVIAISMIEDRYDEALGLVDRALLASPDNVALVGTRLAVLTVMGRGPETIADHEEILRLSEEDLGSDLGVSHSLIARAYFDAGELQRARHHLHEAERFPTPWPIHADTCRRLAAAGA